MKATLTIAYPDGRIEQKQLPHGSYQIGREQGEILLNDPSVSSAHACIDFTSDGIRVTDLGSKNGTFDAEGRRIEGTVTVPPSRPVRVGQVVMTPRLAVTGGSGTIAMPELGAVAAAAVAAVAPAVASEPPAPAHPVLVTESVPLRFGGLNMHLYTGRLLGKEVQSATQVYGSGGGTDHLASLGGRTVTKDVSIGSVTTTQSVLFLEADDGTEMSFQINQGGLNNLMVREGQRLSVIYATYPKRNGVHFAGVYVHETDAWLPVASAYTLRGSSGARLGCLVALVMAASVGAAAAVSMVGTVLMGWIGFACFVVFSDLRVINAQVAKFRDLAKSQRRPARIRAA